MKEHLQLIAITIVLTVLIWVYADRAGFEDLTIDVTFVINTRPEYVPKIKDVEDKPNQVTLRVTLQGPKSAIHRLDATTNYTCDVNVAEALNTDETYNFNVANRLRQWDKVKNQALEIVFTEREFVEYVVDRYVTLDVDVETASGALAGTLDGVSIEPSTVKVTLLESEKKALPDPSAPITLNIVEQLNSPAYAGDPLPEFAANLPTRWQGATIKTDPAQVRIRVRRRLETTPQHFAPINLEVKAPSVFWEGGYQLEFVDETGTRPYAFQDVSVQVPVGKEGRLEAQDIEAYIRIEEEDLSAASVAPVTTAPSTESPLTKPVIFRLPEGFEDFKIDDQRKPTVQLYIRLRPVPVAAESTP